MFNHIHYLLADLDGVFYRGDTPLPGAARFAAWLAQQGIGTLFVTNNSTRSPRQYVEKLQRMGIPVEPQQILTSALATRAYLEERAPPGTPVYLIGERGLLEAMLHDAHFVLEEHDPAYVVVGMDTTLTYDKLRIATLAIRGGARFIGTNPDRTFPSPEGVTPGCGAILAALVAATDIEPTVIGKPERWLLREGLRRLGAEPSNSAMLGDRLETDILGGKRLGMSTLMVLTGVHGREDIERSSIRPDAVFPDLPGLLEQWEQALEGQGVTGEGIVHRERGGS